MNIFIAKKIKVGPILSIVLSFLAISGCSKTTQAEDNNKAPAQSQDISKESPVKPADNVTGSEQYSKLLSVVEVEEIGMLKDVKIAAKGAVIGAGGELNYAIGDTMVLMVQVNGGSFYRKDEIGTLL